jgi:hypothetical protein
MLQQTRWFMERAFSLCDHLENPYGSDSQGGIIRTAKQHDFYQKNGA